MLRCVYQLKYAKGWALVQVSPSVTHPANPSAAVVIQLAEKGIFDVGRGQKFCWKYMKVEVVSSSDCSKHILATVMGIM